MAMNGNSGGASNKGIGLEVSKKCLVLERLSNAQRAAADGFFWCLLDVDRAYWIVPNAKKETPHLFQISRHLFLNLDEIWLGVEEV